MIGLTFIFMGDIEPRVGWRWYFVLDSYGFDKIQKVNENNPFKLSTDGIGGQPCLSFSNSFFRIQYNKLDS